MSSKASLAGIAEGAKGFAPVAAAAAASRSVAPLFSARADKAVGTLAEASHDLLQGNSRLLVPNLIEMLASGGGSKVDLGQARYVLRQNIEQLAFVPSPFPDIKAGRGDVRPGPYPTWDPQGSGHDGSDRGKASRRRRSLIEALAQVSEHSVEFQETIQGIRTFGQKTTFQIAKKPVPPIANQIDALTMASNNMGGVAAFSLTLALFLTGLHRFAKGKRFGN